MPRKNHKHSLIVTSYLKSHPLLRGWTFVPIHGMTQVEVAGVLRDSSLFLSFGHPEGFGLPVAESLACGCTVIGYSGIGGHELFQIGRKYSCALQIPFGDFYQFISTVQVKSLFTNQIPSQYLSRPAHVPNLYARDIAIIIASLSDAFDKIINRLVLFKLLLSIFHLAFVI